MHRQRIRHLISDYALRHPKEAEVVARFRNLIDSHDNCFERDCWTGHITGSAWLVDTSGTRVLLTHHRKLKRWLQLGGHSDGDPDPLRVATREAEEESGLRVRAIDTRVFDLDVHEIPARKSDPAHYHFDVRFALRASAGEEFSISDESLDLAWVPLEDIRDYTVEESILRMVGKWADWRAD